MSDGAKVTIGVPLYNEGRYLRQSLQCLVDQDFHDVRILLSDNASTDETETICREFSARDPRVEYVRNVGNVGQVGNFLRVLDLATTEFFMWGSGHDLWARSMVRRCVEILEADSSVFLAYPRSTMIDEEGKVVGPTDSSTDTRGWSRLRRFNRALWGVGCAWCFCGVFRRSALAKARVDINVMDAEEVILSELSLDGTIANVPETLFFPRRNWGIESRTERMRRLRQMLNRGDRQARVSKLEWMLEEFRVVNNAQVSFPERMLLAGSVPIGLLARNRVHLPAFFRRRVADAFDANQR